MADKIYTFRVLIDGEDDIFRDIEIEQSATFLDFHKAIMKAFNFKTEEMSTFYLSNDDWEKGHEIAMEDFSGKNEVSIMGSTRVDEKLSAPGERLIYIFDFMLMWSFSIDFISVSAKEKKTEYPRCVNTFGDAPSQYEKDGFISMANGQNPSLSKDMFEDFDEFNDFQ